MWSNAKEIAAGDLVIIWLTREDIQPLIITPGKELNLKFGHYRHSELIGVPYGSKVGSRNGRGFIHVLRPTPELWTMSLPHRTQILYLADIAFIVSYLNIKSGSTVVEAGTGSGSFSHSVARTVGDEGRLYSYEFHEARAGKARDEFERHGMSKTVSVTHRNVCKDGFTIVDEADSVFLDLPAPWSAIQHAKKTLRKDRLTRICCFSPCIEQVLRTVSALNEAGFSDITMYETLLRPHEVNQVPKLQPVSEVSARLKDAMVRREDRRLKQVAAAHLRRAQKRKRADDGEAASEGKEGRAVIVAEEADEINNDSNHDTSAKKLRTSDNNAMNETSTPSFEAESSSLAVTTVPKEITETANAKGEEMDLDEKPLAPSVPFITSKVVHEVRGHTSYLTFATLEPSLSIKQESQAEFISATKPEPALLASSNDLE